MIQIDDFYVPSPMMGGLRKIHDALGVQISVFVLLGRSDEMELLCMEPRTWREWTLTGVHGWNHFCEPSFGYWEMRHLLETAISWCCFDRVFTMPWNRMPRAGAIKALREKDFTLITPYAYQRVAARLMGCKAIDLKPDMLLHPPDLMDHNRIEEIIEFYEKRDSESE